MSLRRQVFAESLSRSVSDEAGLRESNEEQSSENSLVRAMLVKIPLVAKMATTYIFHW